MGPGFRQDDTEFVVTAVANNSTLQNITGTILLAGAGKMGGAMLTGWLAGGLDPRRVAVIDPHLSPEISALAAKGVALNPDVKTAGTVETLVVAVKPQYFREAGVGLKPFVSDKTSVVSIMAGTTIASIAEVCGGAVVRAMPNTPAAIGRGITVAVAANNVSTSQRAVADALLRATGSVEWVDDESLMDAVTAVSGSGPAYVFLLAEELARAGVGSRPAGGAGDQARARDRRRLRRASAPVRACLQHAAPERHLARRHHRRSARGADGRARPARSDDPRDRRRDAALEGVGEVVRCRRVGKGALFARRAYHVSAFVARMVGTLRFAHPTISILRPTAC